MTDDERQKLDQIHAFFFKTDLPKKPSRAEQIDQLLGAVRAGKVTTRVIMWAAGLIIAVTGVYSTAKGLWPK